MIEGKSETMFTCSSLASLRGLFAPFDHLLASQTKLGVKNTGPQLPLGIRSCVHKALTRPSHKIYLFSNLFNQGYFCNLDHAVQATLE